MDAELFNELEGRSDRTIQNHKNNVRLLNDLFTTKNLKFTQHKRVIKALHIRFPNANTRGNYLSTLIKYLELIGQKRRVGYKAYKKELKSSIKIFTDKPVVVKNINFPLGKKKFLTYLKSKDYKTSEKEFVLALYLFFPPRRNDYTDMKFSTKKDNLSSDNNYLIKVDGKYFFKFIKFKTAKKFGEQLFQITDKNLLKVLRKKDFKQGDFIYGKSKRQLSRILGDVTQIYFGQRLNINDMRKLHSDTKYKKVVRDLQDDSEKMGHSVLTKLNFYITKK